MLLYLQVIDSQEERNKFELLHEHYKGLMYYISYGILHNQQDAEEAVYDAFWKIAKNISRISEPVCPKTRAYIVQVVESTSVDIWRKQRRRVETVPLKDEPKIQAVYDGKNRVTELILKLPAHDREVLLLRYHQGYSLRETAQLLGLSEAAARKREQRAKNRLEELCREEELL